MPKGKLSVLLTLTFGRATLVIRNFGPSGVDRQPLVWRICPSEPSCIGLYVL